MQLKHKTAGEIKESGGVGVGTWFQENLYRERVI